ncbi:ankyrin repeat domain-containing protein 16-like [Tigriopus californicus]|uniref:ankyrin repeat domain-containing protein 16-like n=1 Tax=Tigriopus californicus TaxID=6832 RepID=UPI0027DA30F6|nr:ankyrin repeat domain-containing protein 16-like [Tigriopus californicus]
MLETSARASAWTGSLRKALWAAAQSGPLSTFQRQARACWDSGVALLDWRAAPSGDHVAHLLCRSGQLDALRFLVDLDPALGIKLFSVTNREAKGLLHEAAQYSQTAVMTYLLSVPGVAVDVIKRGDWTPLMLACTKAENGPIVQLLLSAGADASRVNKDGWTAFHLASRLGDVTIPVDQPDTCGSTPLMDSARCGIPSHLSLLHEHGHSCLAVDTFGRQSLHIAAQAGQVTMVRWLVAEFGLAVEGLDKTGMTPLHLAVLAKQANTVQALLDLSARVSVADAHDRTPLDLARALNCDDIVQRLMRAGA